MEFLLAKLTYILAFSAVIFIIVFIHEFGHYIVAKWCGVKIETFSIGFGKEICGWNDKSGTRWRISLLPFGGYVKMYGDSGPASDADHDKLEQMTVVEKEQTLHHKNLWQKSAIVAAGPIANFILAIVIISIFFMVDGKSYVPPIVAEVVADGAAIEAGIEDGDTILAIDGDSVTTFNDIQRNIALNTGDEITLTILRNHEELEIALTPKTRTIKDSLGAEHQYPVIGIRSGEVEYKQFGLFGSIKEASIETYNISGALLTAVGQLITGKRSIKEISGPIGIAKMSGDAAKQGFRSFFWFIVLLSINLGLINLFPIPVLDGGHLLYYLLEACKGSPLGDPFYDYGMRIGFAFIISLMVFAVVNDITKIIPS